MNIKTLTLSLLLLLVTLHGVQAQCYGGYGYYNNGGWYGTGIPNGLGWTMFGIAAAGALLSQPTVVVQQVPVPYPVYVRPTRVSYDGAHPVTIYPDRQY